MLRPASLGLRYATHRELKIEAEGLAPLLALTDGTRSFACSRLGTTRVSLGFKAASNYISCKMNILFFFSYFPPFDIYISRWSTQKVFQPRVPLSTVNYVHDTSTSPREIHPASALINVRPPTSPERLVRRQTIVVTSTKKDLLYLYIVRIMRLRFFFFLFFCIFFFVYIYICVYVNVPILYGARSSAISFRFII